MSISGQDRGQRPLSTAELAAAGRRPAESRADDERESEENRQSGGNRDLSDNEVTGTYEAPAFPGERRATAEREDAAERADDDRQQQEEALEPLFTPDMTETYRSRWRAIQTSFVDDPRQAVRQGDELVAQIMSNLANSFAEERHRVEAQLDATGEGTTENLRVALRRYRSFFDRLLSL
jgi:hypothetical protein